MLNPAKAAKPTKPVMQIYRAKECRRMTDDEGRGYPGALFAECLGQDRGGLRLVARLDLLCRERSGDRDRLG